MLKSLVVASSFAYPEEDAMVVKFNTTSAVLVSLVVASSFAYPIEDAMDKEIDVTYTTSIFLLQDQHIVISVAVVARRDDMFARREAFEHLIILRILTADADLALRGS